MNPLLRHDFNMATLMLHPQVPTYVFRSSLRFCAKPWGVNPGFRSAEASAPRDPVISHILSITSLQQALSPFNFHCNPTLQTYAYQHTILTCLTL